jgi:hypothetical protein
LTVHDVPKGSAGTDIDVRIHGNSAYANSFWGDPRPSSGELFFWASCFSSRSGGACAAVRRITATALLVPGSRNGPRPARPPRVRSKVTLWRSSLAFCLRSVTFGENVGVRRQDPAMSEV